MRFSLLRKLFPLACVGLLVGPLPVSALLFDDTPSISIKKVTVRSQDEVGGDDVYLKIYVVKGNTRMLLRETKSITLTSGQSHNFGIGDLSFGNDPSSKIVIEAWDADAGLRGKDDLLQRVRYSPNSSELPSFEGGDPNWGTIEANVCDRACHLRNFEETQAALNRKQPNKYLVTIDCRLSSIENEGTRDRLTIELWAGNSMVNSLAFDQLSNVACARQDQTITVISPSTLTHVAIVTSGNDAFFIDKLHISRNGRVLLLKEGDGFNGYCLSTDATDATRTWRGYVSACKPRLEFSW
ncbi:hypothetical protein IQ216_01980 [Cyanobium sp. LEGE 06143]|uniref:hypothetical protein n=1 Tax=Cyanobium sp. LEGE 06143 TaxID=945727 RepID=UPI00187F668C|nr:hypothetical protein [Cyanobium sp. LEGE 06143]MBE9171893.1 hypothetical protein [Cyanobium sp. LEGE 06143]